MISCLPWLNTKQGIRCLAQGVRTQHGDSSADPYKMLPYAALHLVLHCLPKYLFYQYSEQKGLIPRASL